MLEKERDIVVDETVNEIARSFAKTSKQWAAAKFINCYAFSRRLTFPDKDQKYYAPGKLYSQKYGHGNFAHFETNPDIIHDYIMSDSLAIDQPCTRVNFDEIVQNDGKFYFGLAFFHMCPSKIKDPILHSILKNVVDREATTLNWHFICRTPAGIWLHKPNWVQPAEEIEW